MHPVILEHDAGSDHRIARCPSPSLIYAWIHCQVSVAHLGPRPVHPCIPQSQVLLFSVISELLIPALLHDPVLPYLLASSFPIYVFLCVDQSLIRFDLESFTCRFLLSPRPFTSHTPTPPPFHSVPVFSTDEVFISEQSCCARLPRGGSQHPPHLARHRTCRAGIPGAPEALSPVHSDHARAPPQD